MTFTKISGAILAAFLIIMGLKEISHLVYHPHELEEAAYPIEVPETLGAGGAAEEEGPLNLGLLLANADVAAGEQVARKCASCHTFEEGAGNLTGPHLFGVVGRMAGAVSDFNYSSAMAELNEPWSYENLNHFLENPRGWLPGTAMSFAGIRDDQERVNLIAYLASITPDAPDFPEPLPEEEPAAEGEGEDVAAAGGEAAPDSADSEVTPAAEAEPQAEPEDAVPQPALEDSEEIAEETAEAADAADAAEVEDAGADEEAARQE